MKLKKILTGFVAAAVMAASSVPAVWDNTTFLESGFTVEAAESSVKFYDSAGYGESVYAEWAPVSNAEGYNVYVDGTQIDSMLIRQYSGYYRADAVGLKAGSHTMKVVPVINGKEDTSKAAETKANAVSYDRTGFGWINGTSSGAYNEDGTLRSNAVVLYITERTKDTVSLDVVTNAKGSVTNAVGLQNIINLYKKGYDSRPLDIRIIGQVTDPAVLENGDLVISGTGDAAEKRLKCGITIEGIGDDAVLRGFGLRLKNLSNCEIRNMAIMLVDSSEGDNYSLQQGCDHVWVHNCDSFYGMPGSDSDQKKGDGALDCKLSTYITFSYNHFWDNGKCNLLGLKENTTDGLYITYHHNWYDHSDSRHPRVRFYSAHVYNNYYDGNAKYGMGSTNGSSILSENNYFRNCIKPMLISMQGTDIAEGEGTFSSEDGGIIKSYGNIMEGTYKFVPYSKNNTEFDAYDASSLTEKVPSSVLTKKGSTSYNNFDTNSSIMYSWKADAASDVPAIVTSNAGRQGGGDFEFSFTSADDTDYSVNSALMTKLQNYVSPVIAIGSGFDKSAEEETVTTKAVTTAAVTTSNKTSVSTVAKTTTPGSSYSKTSTSVSIDNSADVIYASPNGSQSGKGTKDSPYDVLTAISAVKPGGRIYLLGGTYKFSETILINKNNGQAGKPKMIEAYPGADVLWDFSGQGVADANRGLILNSDYWYFKGFEIANAGDNGVLLSGSNNTFELMEFTNNQDTGLQISRYDSSAATIADWPSNNLILNCTSKDNCDNAKMENADGFAAKLTCGEGNVFDGCIAYNNSDDGWDLFAKTETGPIGVVTLRNCVAFRNGFTEYGEGFGNCDGNGFKLGGSGVGSAHIVENCLAFENLNCGFTDNNNPKLESLTNCTAYNNGVGGNGKPNFSLYRCTDDGCDFKNVITYINNDRAKASFASDGADKITIKNANDKFVGTIENSIYYNSKYYFVSNKIDIENGAKKGDIITPTDEMFVSLDVAPYKIVGSVGVDVAPESSFDFHTKWRNPDGSVNTHGFAQVKDSSTYKGIGVKFTDSGSEYDPGQGGDQPIDFISGDVTNDGKVNVFDSIAFKRWLVANMENDGMAAPHASAMDTNGDGFATVSDLVLLNQFLKGQNVTFKVYSV